jgi:Uma2 family endonuclease
MLAQSNLPYTVEDYLALERESEERHVYLDGDIFEMAGESPEHGTISVNLVRVVSTQLLGTPWWTFSKDMKVGSGPGGLKGIKGLYSYPDLLVVCGEMKFHDKHRDVLINPTVIIEVLSKSTEAFDRGEKFQRFQTWNPTLIDYLLVSQTSAIIEHFVRQSDGGWSYHKYEGQEQSLWVESIDCTLRLAEVYDRIDFGSVADSQPQEDPPMS